MRRYVATVAGAAAISLMPMGASHAANVAAETTVSFPDFWCNAATGRCGSITAVSPSPLLSEEDSFVFNGDRPRGAANTATGLRASLTIDNQLSGMDLTFAAELDSVKVGEWTVSDCGLCGLQDYSLEFAFAPISSGTRGLGVWNLYFTIQDSSPGGSGGVAFENGGTVTIVGRTGGVPEPRAWALMILGFATAGATLRRRFTAQG